MNLSDFRFTRLTKQNLNRDFDCGDNDLNDFIRDDAWKYQTALISVTYLFENADNKAAAFFSVSNDSLKDQDYEKWNRLSRNVPNPKRRKDYPAVKIGRLGLSLSYRSNSLGSQILFFVKKWFTIENKTGCRFVLVDAYNKPEVIHFYEKNGFIILTEKDKEKRTRLMYFDLIQILPESE